jgi:hypothetical protein
MGGNNSKGLANTGEGSVISYVEVSFYTRDKTAFSNSCKYVFSSKQTHAELVEGIVYIANKIATNGIRTETDGTQIVNVDFQNQYTGYIRPVLQQHVGAQSSLFTSS